jgi:hypothetical protein
MALDSDEKTVQRAVFERDGHRCQLYYFVGLRLDVELGEFEVPRCQGPNTFHHRRKASAQGAYVEANGVTLCALHNRWVEDHPDRAVLVLPLLVVREADPEWESLGRRANR